MFSKMRVRMSCTAVLALIALTFAAPSRAQQPSASAIAVAKEILELKGAKSMFEPFVHGVVAQARNAFMQTNFVLQKDINEVAVLVQREFEPRLTQIMSESARIYASKFTEQELKELAVFYKSPLGKKVIIEEPRVLDQTMTFGEDWASKLGEEVLAKFRAEMKKRGHDL